MTNTLVLDVDGTLVDTNYHHAVAWYRAFRRFDLTVPTWRLHRAIGMGGDKLVAAVAGEHVERQHGDDLRKAWEVAFEPMLAEIRPLEGAHRLVAAALEQDFTVVLASSGKRHHVDHYVKLIDASGITSTSSDDVEDSKPAPDLVTVDHRGVARPITDERRDYWRPRISPDGARVAVEATRHKKTSEAKSANSERRRDAMSCSLSVGCEHELGRRCARLRSVDGP